jgi:hypothetical protein
VIIVFFYGVGTELRTRPCGSASDGRRSIETWTRPRASGRPEIATFAQQLVDATNASYREFAGTDDLGHQRAAGR